MHRREFLKAGLFGYGAYSALWRDARAQGTSHAPDLKITAVRVARFRKIGHPFVRIYTDQGVTGTGEFNDEIGASEIVSRNLGPSIVGMNPLDIENLYRRLWTGPALANGLPEGVAGHISPVFVRGMGGPYLAAMSGLDIALWDLAGKAMGVPIYRLMGGRVRHKVPVYFDVPPIYQNPDNLKLATEAVNNLGVKMIKSAVDGITRLSNKKHNFDPTRTTYWRVTNRQIDELVNYVGKLREAVGTANMAIEMHTCYDVESAVQIAHAIEPFHPAWIEEPVHSDNPDAMAEVRRATSIPVACGENIYTRFGFRPFFEKQAMSVAQPDMGKTGGLMEGRKIAAMAEVYNIPIAPHGMASNYGITAMAHVCATVPNLYALEWGAFPSHEYDDLFPRPGYKDGLLELPEGPGVGIELNQDFIKEAILPGFEFPPA
jgi:galactonate dehydratase